jgi:hypothetical protein
MVLFDCDDPAEEQFVFAHCGETSHKLKTPRGGIHLGYRRRQGAELQNLVKIKGRPIDIRTDGGLEMIPPSVTGDGRYEWLGEGLKPISELPYGNVGWTRERTRKRASRTLEVSVDLPEGKGSIRFPEQYCLKIESVQGQNGSRALVRVVAILRDAGRSPEQIFDYVKNVWNPACARPEWSDAEIRHCIERHCTG